MVALTRPLKITLGGNAIVPAFAASWSIARTFTAATRRARFSADQWPDHVRLSDLESRFVCKACGQRGADVRPDFPAAAMGALVGPL